MSACTFFGHRDTPKEIEPLLQNAIIEMIIKEGVTSFYIGNQGNFDNMVKRILKELKNEFPQVSYSVVLAYMPEHGAKYDNYDYSDTIYPCEIAHTPRKYAINKRNRWMIDKSDYVITYVKYKIGGAVLFKEIAENKNKTVINLAIKN